MLKALIKDFVSLGIIIALSGCTVRGYSGPAKPESEVSTVTLNKAGEISIESIQFDGRDVSTFASNIELLPGQHDFQINYSIEEEPDCDIKKWWCIPITKRGICEGHLSTLVGRTYLLTLEDQYSYVDLRIAAKGYFDFSSRDDEPDPGYGSCR